MFPNLVQRRRRPLFLLGASLALAALGARAHAIDYTSANAGDWSVSTHWSPVGVPGGSDTVTINHAISTVSFVQVGNVTVNSGGALNAGNNFATSGDLTLNGTGTASFPGSMTFNGSGLQTVTGAPSFQSTVIISNTAATPSDAACVQFATAQNFQQQLSVSDGQVLLAHGSQARNVSIGASGLLKHAPGGTFTLTCGSSTSVFSNTTLGTYEHNNGTLVIGGTGLARHQVAIIDPIYNLTINNTAATPTEGVNDIAFIGTYPGTENLLRVQDGMATIGVSTHANVQIDAAGVFNSLGTQSITGNWTQAPGGTLTPAALVAFTGSGPQAINGGSFGNVQISNTSIAPSDTDAVTCSGSVSASGQLTVADGQFMPANGNSFRLISISAAGILKPAAGAEVLVTGASGSTAFFNSGSFVHNGSTLAFTGNTQQQLTATVATVLGNVRAANTAASPSSTADVENFSSNISVSGTLTVEDGMATWRNQVGSVDLQADGILTLSSTLAVSGDWTKAAAGTFTPSGFTVNFNGPGAQAITGATAFAALAINNTAATPSDSAAVVGNSPVTSSGPLSVADGQFMPANGSAFRDISIGGNGILKPATAGEIAITGSNGSFGFFNFGTLVANGGTVAFTSNAGQQIGATVPTAFHNIRVANTAATPDTSNDVEHFATTANLTMTGTLTVEDGLATWKGQVGGVSIGADGILGLSSPLSVSGDWTLAAGGQFAPSSAAVTFNGSGAQAISGAPTTFAGLIISNTAAAPGDSSAVTASTATTSTSQLLVNDGQFMPANGSSFRDVMINPDGILKPVAGAEVLVTGANGAFGFINLDGTLVANSGTFAFTGSVGQQIGATVATVFHNIRVANTAATPDTSNDVEHFATAAILSMTGSLTVEDGLATWKGQVANVDLQANGLLGLNDTLSVSGDWTKAAAGTFTPSGLAVNFNGTGAQSINGATDFALLSINNTAASPSDSAAVVGNSPVTSSSQLAVFDGQFMPANGSAFRDISISANGILKPAAASEIAITGSNGGFSFSNSAGTLNANGGTISFTGNSKQRLAATVPTVFHNIRVANTAATPDTSNDVEHFATTANISMTGTLDIEDGMATWKGSTGGVELGAAGLLNLTSSLNVSGDWTHVAGGAFTPNGQAVNFNGSGLQTIAGPTVFDALVVTNTAAAPSDTAAVVTANPISANAQVTLQDGQFSPSNGSSFRNMLINAAGIFKPQAGADIAIFESSGGIAFQVNGGTVTHNGGTMTFNGTAEQRILATVATQLNNVRVSNSAATPDASNDVEVFTNLLSLAGNLTVQDGRADWRGQVRDVDIFADGILTNTNNFIFVSGDWTKAAAGSYVPTAFAVSFNGNGPQAIGGVNAFGGLSINNSAAAPSDTDAVIPDSAVTATVLSVSDGQFMPVSGSQFTNVTVNANGILKPASLATVSVSGALTVNGSFANNGGTVVLNGNSAQDVNIVPGNPFSRLTVANTNPAPSASQDVAFLQGITVEGDFEVADGLATFPAGSGTHTFGQDFTIAADGLVDHSAAMIEVRGDWFQLPGGSFTATGTVSFEGSGAQSINGTTVFGPVEVANTSAAPSDSSAVIPAAAISATSLVVHDGQFNIPDGSNFGWVDINAGGILKAPAAGTFGILGDLAGVAFDNAGTFDANGSEAIFLSAAPQAIAGSATFFDVRTDGPNASAGAGIAVSGRLSVDGGTATGWRDLNDVSVAAPATWDAASDSVTVSGDVDADGAIDADTATFLFDGAGVQTLETAGALAFGNMAVGATSTVNEIGATDLVTVAGTLVNNGVLRRTRSVAGPGTYTGGLTAAEVAFTASGTVSELVIDRIDSVPNATVDHTEGISWTFAPVGTGYTADVTLPHALAIPAQATVSRYLGTGTNWDFVQSAFTANTVTRTGITDLSSTWAVANRTNAAVDEWQALD